MKITSRGLYGLRFLVDVAVYGETGPVALNDVAARQGISEKYLWQVVTPLKSGGIVETVRGAQGGYRLAKPSSKITLRAVLEVLENPTGASLNSRKVTGRDRDAGAIVHNAIQSLAAAWNAAAESVTLESLAEDHRRMKTSGALMYEI